MEENKNILDSILIRKTMIPSENYFKNLSESIISSEKIKVIPFYKRKITWIGTAAAVAIIVLVSNLIQSKPEQQNRDFFASVDNTEISEYVESNIEEFDTELFVEYVSENTCPPDSIKKEIIYIPVNERKIPQLEELYEDEILKYLREEGVEIEELEEESFI